MPKKRAFSSLRGVPVRNNFSEFFVQISGLFCIRKTGLLKKIGTFTEIRNRYESPFFTQPSVHINLFTHFKNRLKFPTAMINHCRIPFLILRPSDYFESKFLTIYSVGWNNFAPSFADNSFYSVYKIKTRFLGCLGDHRDQGRMTRVDLILPNLWY